MGCGLWAVGCGLCGVGVVLLVCAVAVVPWVIAACSCLQPLNQQLTAPLLVPQVLQPPHGIALVAAKSYYFGVGGGTTTFAERVRHDGILEVRSVWASDDGDGSVRREVLELKFPDSIAPYFL